ncbi:hypothetical protein PINS_up005639 [Pythium insidiosum]|nr:hypothetical protein PINS_up005639 [Pythium insidiosum]
MQREVEEDDSDVHVDEDVLRAFQLAQLSAQYLTHCVDMLEHRVHNYETQATSLRTRRRELRARRRDRVDAHRRLRKQRDELDVLLTTYRSLLQHHGVDVTKETAEDHETTTVFRDESPPSHHKQQQQQQQDNRSESPRRSWTAESPTASGRSLTSSKPAFLMTWEEREDARRRQKELDKAQRIEAEKTRLQQLQRDRQRREQLEDGLARLETRRRQRAARTLQVAVRSFLQRRIIACAQQSRQAAITLQSRVRGFLARRLWRSRRRDELREAREQRSMAQCDAEAREMADTADRQHENLAGTLALSHDGKNEEEQGGAHATPAASALAATWRTLRRIFVAACERGTRVHELFRRLDERADGVLDRAELRTGLRRFGVRLDRTMTRAYVETLDALGFTLWSMPRVLTMVSVCLMDCL